MLKAHEAADRRGAALALALLAAGGGSPARPQPAPRQASEIQRWAGSVSAKLNLSAAQIGRVSRLHRRAVGATGPEDRER